MILNVDNFKSNMIYGLQKSMNINHGYNNNGKIDSDVNVYVSVIFITR